MDAIKGVRFYPTDEELILFLKIKRLDPAFSVHTILEINIYEYEPPQLFGLPAIRHDEKWCNFYCAPYYKKHNSQRLKQLTETGYCKGDVRRSTKTGYWKKTGKDRFIKAKRSKDTIGFKRTLVFHQNSPGSKKIRTNWVMREYIIKYDPLFKEDFVLCRIKRKGDRRPCTSIRNGDKRAKRSRTSTKKEEKRSKKSSLPTKSKRRDKKPRVSNNDEAQPSHDVTFNHGHSRNRVGENTSLESRCNKISRGNHVAENISPEMQPQPSCDLFSNPGKHAAETPEYSLQVHHLIPAEQTTHNGCSVLDQASIFTLQSPIHPESQPPPSRDSICNCGPQAAETREYTSQVDPLPLAKPSAVNFCSGLDKTSLCTHPEEESSYSSVNSTSDYINSNPTPCAVLVECDGEETGLSTPLYLNPSKSAEGFWGGDSIDMGTECFNEWVSNMF